MRDQNPGFFTRVGTEPTLSPKETRRGEKSPVRRAYEACVVVGSLAVLGAVSAWEFWKEWRR